MSGKLGNWKPHRLHRIGLMIFLFLCMILSAGLCMAQNVENSDAVYLERSVRYDIKDADKAYLITHVKLYIRNQDGSDYATLMIGDAPLERLKEFSATVFDADGNVIAESGKNDGEVYCGFSGYALYEDVCFRRFLLRQGRYPYTIDYRYTIECKSLFFWPDWEPAESVPVQHAEYILSVPNDLPFHRQSSPGIEPDSIVPEGNRSTYYFHVDSLTAVDHDWCAASDSASPPYVNFAPAEFHFGGHRFNGASWDSLGRGCYDMMKKSLECDERIEELVDSVRAIAADDRDFCRILHKALSARMRYVAVEIGVGGLIPSRAKETFDRGYGDCKDLAFLYASALRYAGIRAVPVVIRAASGRITEPGFPRINRFNHVILFAVIENDTLWMDPTCQQCGVGDLPSSDEYRYVLAVDDQAPGLVRTPPSQPEDNMLRRNVTIDINPDRSLAATVDIVPRGNLRHRYRSWLERSGESELNQFCRERLGWVGARYAIDQSACLYSDEDGTAIGGHFAGTVRNAIHIVGDKQYINLDFLPYMTSCESDIVGTDNSSSVDLGYPRSYLDSIIINLPDGWRPIDTLQHTEFSDDFGGADVVLHPGGRKLVIVRIRTCVRYSVQRGESIRFGEHLARIRDSMSDRIILIRE